MKILHVIRGLSNSSGTTHIVVPLAEEQARAGHDVTVYCVEKPDAAPVRPSTDAVTTRCFPTSVHSPKYGLSLPFTRAVRQEITHFDVVHIHAVWNFPTYYTMRAAGRADVPYVVAPQGSFDPWALREGARAKAFYGRFVERPLLRRCAFLQALTQKEALQFEDYGLDAPTVIIPNGVDMQQFERQAPRLGERLGLPPGSKTLLYLSRIDPKKGLDVLIRAFAHLRNERPDIFLVIAGHDAGYGHEPGIRALVSSLGLEAACRLLGEVKGDAKYDTLLGADAFALTSHSEGLPIAVLEAMAAGLPVVVSHECNVPAVAERNTGFLVSPEVDEVAVALRELFADEERARRMGDEGRRLVRERFTWSSISSATIRAYQEARPE